MEEFGVYVGKKTGTRSAKSGVPLWKWALVKRTDKIPSEVEIKDLIKQNEGLIGYAMRLKPRPWKKVSPTIKL